MHRLTVDREPRLGCATAAALVVFVLAHPPAARAADPAGFYVGGAFGQARVEAALPDASQFREDHSAFKIMAGLRPIPLLGAEIEYLDFGHPSRFNAPAASDVSTKGAAAVGMLYVPVAVLDVYAKGGVARLQSTANLNPCVMCLIPVAVPPRRSTNTSWTGAAGAQFKLGSVAVRGEYERFNAAGGNPYLLSLGASWTF